MSALEKDKEVLKGEIERVKPLGRPSIISDELIQNIADLVRAGAYVHVAAGACGISPRTFYRWMDEQAFPEPIYQRFREAVLQARFEARARAEIRVALDKPDVWLMRGPGRHGTVKDGPGWSAKEEVQLSGPGGGPVQVAAAPAFDFSRLTDDELEQYERLCAKALASPDGGESSGGES